MSDGRWYRYGERGVLLELDALDEIHALHRAVLASGLALECVPGAATLYVEPLPDGPDGQRLVDAVMSLAGAAAAAAGATGAAGARGAAGATGAVAAGASAPGADAIIRTHTVEVVYDGIDLDEVASLTGISATEVIRLHAAPTYTVAFLGFSRGFPYLVGLDERLVVPRLASPRTRVPAGSIAVGGPFTGIYPASSPGGWRLIGHTDAVLFDERRDPPSVLAPGDRVRFVAVAAAGAVDGAVDGAAP